ncbi:ABC transporter substrate-binding protein [Paenibacillus sp. CMAA1364]
MKRKSIKVVLWCLCLILILPSTTLASGAYQGNDSIIKLAAMLPISGELASKGEIRKLAIEKGVEDANQRFKMNGKDMQFQLAVEDSQSDPVVVLRKAQKLWEKGYNIFIVGSSNEVQSLQSWAEQCGAIVISYSSTSPALSVADDGIFRMVPNDIEQAKALASLLEYEGVNGIIPVYRNDIYGRQLTKLVAEEFTQMHGVVGEAIAYDSQQANWADVSSRITKEIHKLGIERERVAILLIAFDEAADLLQHSEALSDVRWFGSDTVTLSPVILNKEDTAKQANKVKLKGVTFGLPDSPELQAIQLELAKSTNGIVLPDAMFAYDIPGMLASIIGQMDSPFNIGNLKNSMIEGSGIYAGITGWTILNNTGDRKYYHYDIWEVQMGKEGYMWDKTAKFVRNPGAPGYIQPLQSSESIDNDQTTSYLFGYEGQAIDLKRTLTRAEFTYMLMNSLHPDASIDKSLKPTFVDKELIDVRARTAVAKAQQEGIVTGYGKNEFKPNQVITWYEAIGMIVKALDWQVPVNGENEVKLDFVAPTWAKPYLKTALERGLIQMTEQFSHVISGSIELGDVSHIMLEIMKRSGNE